MYLCRVFYFVYLCHVSCFVCPERTVPARTDKYMKYEIRNIETRRARAHVQKYPNHDMWKARSQAVPNHALNLNTIGQVFPETQKDIVHVQAGT